MRFGALFNTKLKKGIDGRREVDEKLKSSFSPTDKVIWMHAASLGEYEQGLPVLEALKMKHPEHKILVSFFSPSGYENVIKKHHIADLIIYLPFDTKSEIKKTLQNFTVDIFFTVKYDYWYNLLAELKKSGSKTFVISALFYKKQSFFKFYGKWMANQLDKNIDWFFHQTQRSLDLAQKIGLNSGSVAGDTRYDRVKALAKDNISIPYVEEFKAGKKLIIFGSSWLAEERIASKFVKKSKDFKIIIAPHDLKRVSQLKSLFPTAILYSQINPDTDLVSEQILIIDNIGILSRLYSYSDAAVVGGGFHSQGLHNILEPAVFGNALFFGSHYKKNPEADQLIEVKGAMSSFSEDTLNKFLLEMCEEAELLQKTGDNAKRFIESQANSTEIIIKKISSI